MPHSPTTLVVMVAVLCACVLVAGAADVVVSVPRGVVETAARPQRSRRLAVDDSTPLMLDLVLAAAPGRIVDLNRTFWDVSTTSATSPQFGHFVSKDAIQQFTQPHQRAFDALLRDLHVRFAPEAIEVSPWHNRILVSTTASRAATWTGRRFRVVPAATPGTDGMGPIVADAGTLPPHHPHAGAVAMFRVAGSAPVLDVSRGPSPAPEYSHTQPGTLRDVRNFFSSVAAGSDPSNFTVGYPLRYWPPPTFLEAVPQPGANAFELTFMVVCANWSSATYPFTGSPPLRAGLDMPCGEPFGYPSSVFVSADTPSQTTTLAEGWAANRLRAGDSAGCHPVPTTMLTCPAGQPNCEAPTMAVRTLTYCRFVWSVELVEQLEYNLQISISLEQTGGTPNTINSWLSNMGTNLPIVAQPARKPQQFPSSYDAPDSFVACEASNAQAVGINVPVDAGGYTTSDLRSFLHRAGLDSDAASLVTFANSASLQAQTSKVPSGSQWNATSIANQGTVSLDASMSVEWLTGTAPGAVTTVFHGGYFKSFHSSGLQPDPLLDVTLAIQYADKVPLVVVLTHNGPEPNMTQAPGQVLEHTLKALGAMGVSVIAAAGDTGAYFPAAHPFDTCSTEAVGYPASSPVVTTVGATQFTKNVQTPTFIRERPCSIASGCSMTTGGGYSREFQLPQYQASVVKTYNNEWNRFPQSWQVGKRVIPDVSVAAFHCLGVLGGSEMVVDGTACAAASFGAMVTMWNDARLRHGLPSLGFLNPELYNMSDSFNDVVVGDIGCVGSSMAPTLCCGSLRASPGWDAATGLGSPKFKELGGRLLGVGQTWSAASCSVSDRVCDVAHICPKFPTWAIIVSVVGGVLALGIVGWLTWRYVKRRRLARHSGVPGANTTPPDHFVAIQNDQGPLLADKDDELPPY